MDFVYEAWPTCVVFACGAIGATGEELVRIGVARVMVVTTPPQADTRRDRPPDRRPRRHRISRERS